MKIDAKYRLSEFPIKLNVERAFDFEIEPILLLERDLIGNSYLSFLTYSDIDKEQRAYLQVSEDRLKEILTSEISMHSAFKKPENNFLYVAEYTHQTGALLDAYLVPEQEIQNMSIVPEDYVLNFVAQKQNAILNDNELLGFAERKQKMVFDFYLQGQNLFNNIKPYALYKIFTPVVEIIKNMLEFDNRSADKYLAFSNLRQSSLGITIEINYSQDLFREKEAYALENLILLLNAQNKEDFKNVLFKTKNNKYLKHYITLIKSIIENDADLHTAYANYLTKEVETSNINKEKAQVVREIINESFDIIVDIEEIRGTFLEIDIDRNEPSFKIYSYEEEFTVKGKIELSILETIKDDFVNIGKESYLFTIKTLYFPETTLKSDEVKRYLIDYKKEEN